MTGTVEPQVPAPVVLGSTVPRLWTRPLVVGPPGPCGCGCALTPPTSYGFEVDTFARDALKKPLDPWERWAAIHAGELLPDGSPRFTTVLILVARQNGKTHLLVVLTLFWLFRGKLPMVLGTSTKLDYARESWLKAVKLARSVPELKAGIPKRGGVRKANGEQELVYAPSGDVDDLDACRYKIAASNEEGGRSLSIDRLILDELRQHDSYEAWDAAEPTTSAVDGSQIWGLSNAGSAKSVVLNDLQDTAREFIEWWDQESGERGVAELLAADDSPGDYQFGLFEWSAPEDADPTDVYALAQANPNMNIRKDGAKLLANARRAVRLGGRALTGFKTEHMCIRVKLLDPAIDPGAWKDCGVGSGLDEVRSRVAMVLDVAPDLRHAVLYSAAVLPSGKVAIDFVKAWEGQGCTAKVRRELPALLARTRPAAFGWFPDSSTAALTADLADPAKKGQPGRAAWPPPGVKVEEIRGETGAVCMGFADLVDAIEVLHSNDPLLNNQVEGAEWLSRGNTKVFSRKGEGHVNAVYAAAGAVHLARTLPPDLGRFIIR
ncbi:terminase [Micromonospora sp. NPDC047548]|uniref:terminase n=1 Tax=Micromonospora sp. NPDC047548 TaxID=3155624 RepID=UPI0034082A38